MTFFQGTKFLEREKFQTKTFPEGPTKGEPFDDLFKEL
jgi:hypothetical protein